MFRYQSFLKKLEFKMRGYRLVLLALTALLAGCFGGDVGRVKDSKLKGWPQFSVGQMLDKQQACSNIKWESFTDTRDRKIVQYTCDNKLVQAYLTGVHEKDVDDQNGYKKLLLEKAAKELEFAESSLQSSSATLLTQKQKVAELESGEGNAKVQALRSDYAMLQRVSAATCSQTDPQQYTHPDVQSLVASMANGCRSSARFQENCPESLKADRFRYLICVQRFGGNSGPTTAGAIVSNALERVQRSIESAEQSVNQKLRYEQEYLTAVEGDIRKRTEELEVAKARAEQAPNDPEQAKHNARIEALNQKIASLQHVREVSQWTVQDGEAIYLGSKVELVFPDRSVQEMVKPEYVFEHAAKDASSVNDLHGFYLMQINTLWRSY